METSKRTWDGGGGGGGDNADAPCGLRWQRVQVHGDIMCSSH